MLRVGSFDLLEFLEDGAQGVRRNAGAGVGYGDLEMLILYGCPDGYFAGFGELEGIAQEVDEDLAETATVGVGLSDGFRHAEL